MSLKPLAIFISCLLLSSPLLADLIFLGGNINNQTGDKLDYDTDNDGTIDISMEQSGNLGIGTTTTSANLHVVGNILVSEGIVGSSTLELSSQILLADGTTAAPALAFKSDTDTGIFLNATGEIMFVTGGTNRIIIDANGNMGIGTTSAGNSLHVVDGITAPGGGANSETFGNDAEATASASTAIGSNAKATGNDSVAVGRSASVSTQGVAVGKSANAAGNGGVAVGLSTSAANSGSVAVGKQAVANGGDNPLAIGNSADATATNANAIGNSAQATAAYTIALGGQSATASAQGAIAIGNAANAGHTAAIALGRSAATTANNQLVIGSSTASITDAYIGEGVTDASPVSIALQPTGASGTDVTGSNFTLASGKSTGEGFGGDLIFSTTGNTTTGTTLNTLVERMRITGTGNIGIGTNSPSGNLHVDGSFVLGGHMTPSSNHLYDLGTAALSWSKVYTDDLVMTSDKRLKKDISDLPLGLEEIMKLRPVQFRWKHKEKDLNYGFIAQEVEKNIRGAVSIGSDPNQTRGIMYMHLVPIVIKSIQEQQSIIAKQNEKIENLSAELEQLKRASGPQED